MSEAAVARAQLVALRTAAALPPLPLAVVHLADTVLRDVVSEVVEQCMHESAKTLPCDASISSLLEGAAETLPEDGKRISAALHRLLSEEISQTARAAKRSREALEPSIAAGTGADIFGNRPKQSSAETVVCTNCNMPLAANRFAPHLERCLLGRGRQRRAAAPSSSQG